jgi:hypothetical protein
VKGPLRVRAASSALPARGLWPWAGRIGRLSGGGGARLRDRRRNEVAGLYVRLRRWLKPCHYADRLHYGFQARYDDYGVIPLTEYDGDPAVIVHAFDPLAH